MLTRLHKPNIVKDLFTGQERMRLVLNHFQRAGRGVLVYLRDGAAGVPVEPVGEQKSAEADRHSRCTTTRACPASASRSWATSGLKARLAVIPGRVSARTRNLEVMARDSGLDAAHRPGMAW